MKQLGLTDARHRLWHQAPAFAESLRYSSEQGFPEFAAMARFCQGWAKWRRGERKARKLPSKAPPHRF